LLHLGGVKMKALLIGLAAIAAPVLAVPAFAADLPVKALPVPVPVGPWTGFYIGANAGAAWLNSTTFTTTPGGTLVSAPFDGSLGWGESLSASTHTAFTGGGQAGYNVQINNWVVGVETDLQYLGARASAANTFVAVSTLNNSFSNNTQWFGTLRLRAGTTVVSPTLLLYVTGGFAYGQEKLTGSITTTLGGETFPFGATNAIAGYAVGGGGEWAIAPHWSIKAEYLFVQLGGSSQQVATTTLGPAALTTDAMTLAVNRENFSIARGGVNYKF
jgi:outer membrane immunogenic protein